MKSIDNRQWAVGSGQPPFAYFAPLRSLRETIRHLQFPGDDREMTKPISRNLCGSRPTPKAMADGICVFTVVLVRRQRLSPTASVSQPQYLSQSSSNVLPTAYCPLLYGFTQSTQRNTAQSTQRIQGPSFHLRWTRDDGTVGGNRARFARL